MGFLSLSNFRGLGWKKQNVKQKDARRKHDTVIRGAIGFAVIALKKKLSVAIMSGKNAIIYDV